ncbi:hypothetical protein ZOSMA_16G00410 [Zostera marina]|uniref:Tr-type G domain-containing protein n=1 Tax=Zostera marina TaxID=29655 RepID=A0A0K9PV02_ZOSMR|nr:hypothetical protein ZOSMA_16G00410 [Zostera marina]
MMGKSMTGIKRLMNLSLLHSISLLQILLQIQLVLCKKPMVKIESRLESLKLEPEVKDIEIDEDKGKKRHLNVVFIGHVDAGKSTIGGQILFLSGQVDDRTIQKYEKEAKDKSRESWYMAYIMDTNEEERLKVQI